MRFTILLHGLVRSAFMMAQTVLVARRSEAVTKSESGKSGGLGIVMALLWVAGGVLVTGALVAVILFGIDGVVGVTTSINVPVLAMGSVVVLTALGFDDWCMNQREPPQVSVA